MKQIIQYPDERFETFCCSNWNAVWDTRINWCWCIRRSNEIKTTKVKYSRLDYESEEEYDECPNCWNKIKVKD